ncbi:MAG: hypothetical protein WC924_03255 [Candidatus Gracilibacteria bacterium]
MPWNPFQFQLSTTYLSDEGDQAVLEIRKGAILENIHFPKNLLPVGLQIGGSFSLKLEDSETARIGETQTLKQLLSELIR